LSGHKAPHRALAIAALVVVMVIWGSSFAVTKASLAQVPPITFAFIRFSLASVILLIMAAVQRRRAGAAAAPAPGWRSVALIGLSGVTLYYVTSNLALYYATASQGALVQSAIPAVTALLAAVMLKERLARRQWAGIGLSVLGALLIVAGAVARAPAAGQGRNPLLGAALMFGAVLVWAVYTVLAKQLAHTDPYLVTAYSAVLGTILLAPIALLELHGQPLPALGLADWLRLLYLGILSSAFGYFLYNWSLAHLSAGQTANFVNLMPIAGVAIAVLFLGESVSLIQLMGGAVVLIGVWLAT
jgi:drug/metabolite transporter (DMT)-like permease